jgi:hypothetical protein
VRAGILQPSNLRPGFSLLPMLGASAQQAIRQTVLALQAPGFCWHIIVMLLSEASKVALTPGCASAELRHCQHELLPYNG